MIDSSYADRKPNENELKLLPPYCAARFGESPNSAAAQSWREAFGWDYNHVHHYCMGLNLINRSYAQFRMEDKRGTLGAAVNEIDYTISHTSPGFVLRPELHLNRGVALSLMKEEGQAIVELQKAIQLDPSLAKAYVLLADQYVGLKTPGKALEAVTEGLRHAPGNKALQRRYDELGGKRPYPEPYAKTEPPSPSGPTESATQASPPEARPPEQAGLNAPSTAQPAMADRNAKDATPKSVIPPTPDGAGKGQWCRFCPD